MMTEMPVPSAMRPSSEIPGPLPERWLGSKGNLIQFLHDPIRYMQKIFRDHGPVAAMVKEKRLGMIFAFGPKYNQQLLSRPDLFRNTGVFYLGGPNAASRRVGFGLLNMNGDQHRRHRNLIQPVFQGSRIAVYRDMIVKLSEEQLGRWQSRKMIDVSQEIDRKSTRLNSSH